MRFLFLFNWFDRIKKLYTWHFQRYALRSVSDLPEEQHIRKYTIYWVGEEPYQWCAVFYCPCGCKEVIFLNLLPTAKPCWTLTPKGKKHCTVFPSVHRIKGCKSHFFVVEGRIRWV